MRHYTLELCLFLLLCLLPVSASTLIDKTTDTTIQQYSWTYDRINGQYLLSLRITNVSSDTLAGPLYLSLNGLSHPLVTSTELLIEDNSPLFTLQVPYLSPGAQTDIVIPLQAIRTPLVYQASLLQHSTPLSVISPEVLEQHTPANSTRQIDSQVINGRTIVVVQTETPTQVLSSRQVYIDSTERNGINRLVLSRRTLDEQTELPVIAIDFLRPEGLASLRFTYLGNALETQSDVEMLARWADEVELDRQANGYLLTLPKSLMQSWTQSDKQFDSTSDPIPVTIIDDDPVLHFEPYHMIGTPPLQGEVCRNYSDTTIRFCSNNQYDFMEIPPEYLNINNILANYHNWMNFARLHAPGVAEDGYVVRNFGRSQNRHTIDSFAQGSQLQNQEYFLQEVLWRDRQRFGLYTPYENVGDYPSLVPPKGPYQGIAYKLKHTSRYDSSWGKNYLSTLLTYEDEFGEDIILAKRGSVFARKDGHYYEIAWHEPISIANVPAGRALTLSTTGGDNFNRITYTLFNPLSGTPEQLLPPTKSLDGAWQGEYRWSCSQPIANSSPEPISITLQSEPDGSLLGSITYSGHSMPLAWGGRFDAPMRFGAFSVREQGPKHPLGRYLILIPFISPPLAYNEFYGQFQDGQLDLFSLNGEDCSSSFSASGHARLTKL
jgi:hypothetical protein